ncbi:MAG: hypothetical protein R2729_11170 [Bryobacteraceae bacterium]
MRRTLSLLMFVSGLHALPPLSTPLRLPPGNRQVLEIDPRASYMADVLRIADCPEDEFNPFGTCANELFGGPATYLTPLRGSVEVRFDAPDRGIVHFYLEHPRNLTGRDTRFLAPQLYRLPVRENYIFDGIGKISEGDLNLATGEVTNLRYDVQFYNSFYLALGEANPRLRGGSFQFPGLYGSADLEFSQRADGLLDVSFRGSTFLPLGNAIQGDPVRVPLAMCGAGLRCANIQAPGSSLHPQLVYSTKAFTAPSCAPGCPAFEENRMSLYTVNASHSTVADRFHLVLPGLGAQSGLAVGHLQGRVQVLFGERQGGMQPFILSLAPPEGFMAPPPESPLSLLGVKLGLFGNSGQLRLPRLTYDFTDVFVASDPLELAFGVIDLESAQVIGKFNFRAFFLQSLLLAVIDQNNGRILPASFAYRGPASFERGADGRTVFRFDGQTFLDFNGLTWPHPSGERAQAFIAQAGSELNPIFRLQAMEDAAAASRELSGSGDLVSQNGERFTYRYRIPCGAAGSDGEFEYVNQSSTDRGGTFKMENLASAACFAQRGSGTADTVAFSGLGTWSKDDDRHLASVQVMGRFVSILIDGGQLSNASSPPEGEPLP